MALNTLKCNDLMSLHFKGLRPQRVAQKAISVLNNIQFQSNKACYKVSLCENFSGKVVI